MRAALAALLLSAAGCASPPPPEPDILVSPERLQQAPDFLARQRVSAAFEGGEASFEAALQKQGDTLTVIGLSPFGTRAFTLVQGPQGVTFESHLPAGKEGERGPPLRPRYLLQDIHHAFFLRLPPYEGRSARGVISYLGADGDVGKEVVSEERDEEGRVLARTFVPQQAPGGRVTVTYEPGIGPDGLPPAWARLENEVHRYRLVIETLSVQRLGE